MAKDITLTQTRKSETANERTPHIALIGCGAIAEQYYVPAITRHPEVAHKMVVVDTAQERTRTVASMLKTNNSASDYHDVIDTIDGAILAIPTHLHYTVAMDLLQHGVHVFCEKPLAETLARAQEMVDAADKSGVVLAVNYLQRLIPSFMKAKELLQNRTLGEPLDIKYWVGEEFKWPTVSGFYFNSSLASRGILRDRGAHVVDHICWWLGGKPRLLLSQNDAFGGSEAVAYVKFTAGRCQGEIKLSWLASFPSMFSINCEKGAIIGDVYDYQNLRIKHKTGRLQNIKASSRIMSKVDIADQLLSNFFAAVSRNVKPIISGRDVIPSLEFIDECYMAATHFSMPWYHRMEVPNAG